MDLAELKKKAQTNPQALSKAEWNEIFKDAFSVPKKVSDESPLTGKKVRTPKKRKSLWE